MRLKVITRPLVSYDQFVLLIENGCSSQPYLKLFNWCFSAEASEAQMQKLQSLDFVIRVLHMPAHAVDDI